MRTESLHPGDPIQCKVRGVTFEATYEVKCQNGRHFVIPDDPKRISYRYITSRQIVKKLERQERLGVAV